MEEHRIATALDGMISPVCKRMTCQDNVDEPYVVKTGEEYDMAMAY